MLSIINFKQAKNSYSFTLTNELSEDFCKDENIEMYSQAYYDYLSGVQQDDFDCIAFETSEMENANDLIAIAQVGTWRGHFSGYKELKPQDLKKCLQNTAGNSCELGQIILNENGDIAYSLHHHDGTNYTVLRERKSNISDHKWEKMLNAIYNQEWDQADTLIKACTKKTGKYIKNWLKH